MNRIHYDLKYCGNGAQVKEKSCNEIRAQDDEGNCVSQESSEILKEC
jgi:hypothetical protein